MINPDDVRSNYPTTKIDVNYVKSCIMNRKRLLGIYQNTKKNILEQIDELVAEEAAIVFPGGESQDNLGIRSSGFTDAAYNQHARLSQANIFERQKKLMQCLDRIEDNINSLHRILQIFNMCAIPYPIHYGICEEYLYRREDEEKNKTVYKEESGFRSLETKYGSSHKTLRAMINNMCEMVRQLTVADLRGEDVTLLSPEEIKNKLSKELIDALDKNEFSASRGRK